MTYELLTGDARDVLATLPAGSVQCVVTSPPYFGLRDYGTGDAQIGLEGTPDEYVAALVSVFRGVRRVLRDDGTVWLNLGDSYASAWACARRNVVGAGSLENGKRDARPDRLVGGLKEKDLIGIPWRVAFALQADGWYLRQDIIWHKPNPMPESVTDRCTKAHEYIFLLGKSARYYYDQDAVRETAKWQDPEMLITNAQARQQKRLMDRLAAGDRAAIRTQADYRRAMDGERKKGRGNDVNRERAFTENAMGRNKRSVWTVPTQPYPEAHFATYPPELIRPCIQAGTRAGDTVLDPFSGSGTTGVVALQHGRRYIGIDLNPEYHALARKRLDPLAAQPRLIEVTT